MKKKLKVNFLHSIFKVLSLPQASNFINNILSTLYVPQILLCRSGHHLWNQRSSIPHAVDPLRDHKSCRGHFETMRDIWDRIRRSTKIHRRLYRKHWNMRPCFSILLSDCLYLFPSSTCLINTPISVCPITLHLDRSTKYRSIDENTAVFYI